MAGPPPPPRAPLAPLLALARQTLPAWGHLPPYYARQPQLAHLARSPLTWHTPTPTPPPADAYRHTPTPPDPAAPHYRHTPPPDALKAAPNPLYNLQQMISDRNAQAHMDNLRDNAMARSDNMGFPRLSPGLTVGSVDLSVTRSPRNGGQNGESSVPMSLSVRDTSKINSLDSAEISKIHQMPSAYGSKSFADISKASSPTINSSGRNSNSPKSPKSSKRPVKKVDSILERLNSGCDGVVITPVRHARSPQSVIVSAHGLEDSNSRGSSSSFNIAPILGNLIYPPSDSASVERVTPSDQTFYQSSDNLSSCIEAAAAFARAASSAKPAESLSVARASPAVGEDDFSNDDSNASSNDSGRSRNRRKPSRTSKIENVPDDGLSAPNVESRISQYPPPNPPFGSNFEATEPTDRESSVSIVSEARRKTSSESETIDDIAAMIASTDSSDKRDPNGEGGAGPSDDLPSEGLPSAPLTENLNRLLSSPNGESGDPVDRSGPESESKIEESAVAPDALAISPQRDEKSEFVEVENELEKMFAGIEEPKASFASEPPPPTIDAKTDPERNVDKAPSKKRSYRKSSDAASSGLLSSDENTPKKKQKLTKRKSRENDDADSKKSKNKNLIKKGNSKSNSVPTKDAYDSGSNASSGKSRGPYIQIKGPRDSPLSVSIINTPIQEEDVDKPLQKIKLLKSKSSLVADGNFKNKVKSKGLHSSTLSMKYDATTTDASWICVFCKKGPHTGPSRDSLGDFANGRAQHMGDLFGPYIISTHCPDYEAMMSDPCDTLFKGKPKTGTFLQNKQSSRGKKIKLDVDPNEEKSNFPNEEMYSGMTEATVDSFEVWLHEDCAVWAPGLYLVGAKIVGLESAVWSCCTMRCDLCNFLGATVACIKRGCERKMHVNCARADLWTLSEDNFLVYCREHGLH